MATARTVGFRNERLLAEPPAVATLDRRSMAERDRDRILYSPQLLRLSSLTQVLGTYERQVFHNRLTHSLKVAQIGRRLAQRLQNSVDATVLEGLGGLDPDVVEAACLAHDIGHPPFGHVAEKALDDLLVAQDAGHFEGNAQSFRIVAKLAVRRNERVGLNLTRATLAATLKYPWYSGDGPADSDPDKFGAYFSERAAFDFARQGAPKRELTLEGQIMDWADDVTYAVHDLEDFFRAGLTPLDRLRIKDGRESKAFVEATTRYLEKKRRDPGMFEAAFEGLRAGFPPEPYSGSTRERILLNGLSSSLITQFINAPTLTEDGKWAVDENFWYQVLALKRLTWHFVITAPGLATLQRGQTRLITELHAQLDEWVKKSWDDRDEQRRLPTALRVSLANSFSDAEVKAATGSDAAIRLRGITDFVASLTEDQAVALHQRLTGGPGMSALEPWLGNS